MLNDGRTGHWRQASALAAYMPVSMQEIRFQLRQPWRLFAPRSVPLGLAMHADLRAALEKPEPCAIISCGRQSALAMRWLQRRLGPKTRTVQILNCGLPPERFSWVVAPLHDGLEGGNVIQTLGSLNPVDDAWLNRAAGGSDEFESQVQPRVTVLLGGPSGHFAFSRSWFSARLADLNSWVAGQRGSLVLVASPRTPAWVVDVIRADRAGKKPYWIPWRSPGTEATDLRYAAAIAQADCLVVSADSVNLVSEACATGKPVFVMGRQQLSGRVSRFCERMLSEGYILTLDRIGSAPFPATVCLRETEKVASQLIASGLLA